MPTKMYNKQNGGQVTVAPRIIIDPTTHEERVKDGWVLVTDAEGGTCEMTAARCAELYGEDAPNG